jgi:hypothetical protein
MSPKGLRRRMLLLRQILWHLTKLMRIMLNFWRLTILRSLTLMILTLERKKGPKLLWSRRRSRSNLWKRKIPSDTLLSPVKTMDPQDAVESKIALGFYCSFLWICIWMRCSFLWICILASINEFLDFAWVFLFLLPPGDAYHVSLFMNTLDDNSPAFSR